MLHLLGLIPSTLHYKADLLSVFSSGANSYLKGNLDVSRLLWIFMNWWIIFNNNKSFVLIVNLDW